MQTSYQDHSILSKSRPVVLNSPSTNDVRNTYLQPNLSSEVGNWTKHLVKIIILNGFIALIFRLLMAVEQMTTSQNLAPLYVHNIARTKYFNVSRPATPSEHNKVNLYA